MFGTTAAGRHLPGTNATPEHCDIRDAGSVARILQDTLDGGGIDWIVNAAGVGYYAPIDERYAPQRRHILDTNLLSTLTVLAQTRILPTSVRHFVQIAPGYVGNTGFGRNFFAHAPDQRQPILDRFPPLSRYLVWNWYHSCGSCL